MLWALILSILFFLLLGFTIIYNNSIINTAREFRAPIYNSDIIQVFLGTCMVTLVLLVIYIFFFYSWKLFLIILFISYLIETPLVVPLLEKTLGVIVTKIVSKNDE